MVASVGVAPNKFLAEIANDLKKPDGLVVIDPQRVTEFLDSLPAGRLWGVLNVSETALRRLDVETIGQLHALSIELLRQQFDDSGEHFWRLARGLEQMQGNTILLANPPFGNFDDSQRKRYGTRPGVIPGRDPPGCSVCVGDRDCPG